MRIMPFCASFSQFAVVFSSVSVVMSVSNLYCIWVILISYRNILQ